MVSSTDGSSTSTFWKRRSSAASFSMYLRYSSSVVAPTQCSSPRASAGFEHVAGVHGAFGFAGADHGVQLVDEQDDLAFLLRQIVQHGLEALFELAAELGAGDECAHVEREDALALQALGHFAVDDALGEAFHDGGLADAGLADEHRVVLRCGAGAPGSCGGFRRRGRSRGRACRWTARAVRSTVYFLQGLAAFFGVRVLHFFAAAHVVDGLSMAPLTAPESFRILPRALVVEGGQHEQLARDVLVAALLGELVRDVQDAVQVVRDVDFAEGAFHFGQAVELGADFERSLLTLAPAFSNRGRTPPPCWSSRARRTWAGSMNWWSRPTARDWASARACWKRAGEFVHAHRRLPKRGWGDCNPLWGCDFELQSWGV